MKYCYAHKQDMSWLETALALFHEKKSAREKKLQHESESRNLDYERQKIENSFTEADYKLVTNWEKNRRAEFDTDAESRIALESELGEQQEQRNYELGKIQISSEFSENMSKEQDLLLRNKSIPFLVIAGLVVMGLYFYWYEWRPSQARTHCAEQAQVSLKGKDKGFGSLSVLDWQRVYDLYYSNCLSEMGI